MEPRLLNLKNDFNNLINIRNNVKNIFEILQLRIDKLKLLYSEFIQNNKNQVFVFGLDSFHFQSKLIDIEYDDTKRLFMAIGNRMYCEYFKLNKIIIEYILNNIKEKKITEIIKINNYPIYKDLEPFKEYKFETLMDIHENILKMVTILVSELNNKENELTIHKTKQHIGLNIDNFVTTFNFNNNVMKERITMFITYIEFFHKLHTKYLKRFSNKIQLIYTDINNDIKFDESLEISSPRPSSNKSPSPVSNKSINSNPSPSPSSNKSSNKSTNSSKSTNKSTNSSNKSNNKSTNSNKSNNKSNNKSTNSNKSNNKSTNSNKSTNKSSNKSSNSIKSSKSDNSDKIISRKSSSCLSDSSSISSKSDYKNDDLDETDSINLNKSVSDEAMNKLFLNIESSCESIINKNKETGEAEVINDPLSEETIIDSNEINDEQDNIELQIEEKQVDEKEESNDEIKDESNIIEIIESDPDPEPETKKKRTYKPRKKKV